MNTNSKLTRIKQGTLNMGNTMTKTYSENFKDWYVRKVLNRDVDFDQLSEYNQIRIADKIYTMDDLDFLELNLRYINTELPLIIKMETGVIWNTGKVFRFEITGLFLSEEFKPYKEALIYLLETIEIISHQVLGMEENTSGVYFYTFFQIAKRYINDRNIKKR